MPKLVPIVLTALTLGLAALALRAADGGDQPAAAPQGAVVLFDGKDASAFTNMQGKDCPWKVENGYMEVGGGNIITKQKFGDCTLHVEFWIPKLPPERKGQDRGNSGVYLQGRYEVQVLDSFGLKSQNNDCGAIYGVRAPSVNACKPPEEWQSYDITFQAARFDQDGKKTQPARFIKVVHNGQVIHEKVDVPNSTTAAPFKEAPADGPLHLQDHGHKVRYRNIWVVPAKAPADAR